MVRAICFTKKGIEVIKRLKDAIDVAGYVKMESLDSGEDLIRYNCSLEQWAREGFLEGEAIVFVGAMGIAVRSIADLVKDKLTDSPVIVIDDNGRNVIPVLSGHMGGANELALRLADILDAYPVITTSTDINEAFSPDLFAKEHGLKIENRSAIKKIAAKSIEGKPVTISIKDYPPKEVADIVITDIANDNNGELRLIKKKYTVGMGYKKEKTSAELEKKLLEILQDNNIDIDDVFSLATIDIKAEGLKRISQKYRIPIISFEADVLAKVKGEFSSSSFVKDTVGVDNVCERSAVLAAGQNGKLIVRKIASDGITVAIASI